MNHQSDGGVGRPQQNGVSHHRHDGPSTVHAGSSSTLEGEGSVSSSSTADEEHDGPQRLMSVQRQTSTPNLRPSTAPGRKEPSSPDIGPTNEWTSLTPTNQQEGRPKPTEGAKMKPQFLRSKSDFGPRGEGPLDKHDYPGEEAETWIRHGWEDTYSSEFMHQLSVTFFMYFTEKRHETSGNPKDDPEAFALQEWRMRDRLKTVSAALTICLNLGVDPPDVIKTNPCARTECWVDPTSQAISTKAMELIGKNLQNQYESLSIRTRYRQYLDPSVEETKKFCIQLRRNAKDERILFHYNGHGVPKPTASGEIWVFNKNFTQYIPISLYDLQAWLGAPSLFVYDCSDAGNIVSNFNRFIDKHETENAELRAKDPNHQSQSYGDCIQLAACGRKETLPTNPDLPADLFTCCLTTPIAIALRFFVLQNPLPHNLSLDDIKKLPGTSQERRTPMGELNWIFTAITDTIAWSMLPRSLFKKLFRQDLMVAALFRNFLLSQRIMRVHHCHPQSWPKLPDTHDHPLWQSWDLAVEMVLAQLPQLLEAQNGKILYEYRHSSFFTEQLTAFEVYLDRDATSQKAPEQLPVLLQVLLSQVHRLRALILLSRFLDLGPWAVNLALSIGIFPYVLKLLQSAAIELKPVMIFIWARILAVDQSCQADLLKDNGYNYFVNILNPVAGIPIKNEEEHRAMCAFIVAIFCKGFHQGQVVCLGTTVISSCLVHLHDASNPLLRQWACLCLSQIWINYPDAKWQGIREDAPQRLCDLAFDPVPEVRAAMLYALNNFMGITYVTNEVAEREEGLASTLLIMTNDGNIMVRKELLVFFSTFVKRYLNKFLVAAYEQLEEERQPSLHTSNDEVSESMLSTPVSRPASRGTERIRDPSSRGVSFDTTFAAVWKHVLIMSVDPYPEIADNASTIVDYVHGALLKSTLAAAAQAAIDDIVRGSLRSTHVRAPSGDAITKIPQTPPSPAPSTDQKEGYFSSGFKRTASVAASLKHLAFGSSQSIESSPSAHARIPSSKSSQRLSAPPRTRAHAEWNVPPDQHDPLSNATSYLNAKVPLPKNFKSRNHKNEPVLPLVSKFLEWSIEYFREPQMKIPEAEEPGSLDYNERLWRLSRNERILAETQPLKAQAGTHKWDVPSGLFQNGSQPTRMFFHQFENHLAVSDDRDGICIWDWKKQNRLNRFSNNNPIGSKMNDVRFINEDDQALLMTGSSDGVIKVYRNYESSRSVELVSSWRALTDLVNSNYNAGLVFDWQQGQGKAIVAGDVKVIRVWNALTEVCTNDIPARSGSCITSLTSDQVAGNVFVAGFGDGALRVYDQRQPAREAMVKVWKDHKQWITNVHMQRGGLRELVSASRNGEVKLWDIRMDRPLRTIKTTKDTLRSLSVHEHAPVFAVGTAHHAVKVFNMDGTPLSDFEPYSSFLHQNRSAPISITCLHPHRMMLACSSLNDNHINLVSCEGKQKAGMEFR
ncbi:MAG: adenylosuccinase ade13 [Chaenotheca gracillima]|nr:MAG: adenylosuccinase ade13 [Chaenotheca gracillima]